MAPGPGRELALRRGRDRASARGTPGRERTECPQQVKELSPERIVRGPSLEAPRAAERSAGHVGEVEAEVRPGARMPAGDSTSVAWKLTRWASVRGPDLAFQPAHDERPNFSDAFEIRIDGDDAHTVV